MKIKNKKTVIANISEEKNISGGIEYTRWVADLGVFDGVRKRIRRGSKAELLRAIDDWYMQKTVAGDGIIRLSPHQVEEAAEAYSKLEKAGRKASLPDIVQFWLDKAKEQAQSVTMLVAYETYLAKYAEHQKVQIQMVKKRVGKFAADAKDVLVCDVSAELVTKWLDGHEAWSATTWNNTMRDIRSFFAWCMKKKWLTSNPLEAVDAKTVAAKRPECATVEDVAKLFKFLETWTDERRDAMLLRYTLAFFCGMRTSEIQRQSFEDIRLEDQTLVVTESKGEQSGGRCRAFQIPETAMAWLKIVNMKKAEAKFPVIQTWHRWSQQLFIDLKVDFPENAGRHSFITYDVAKCQSREHAIRVAGNSEDMQKNHYDGLASQKDGIAYFAVLPKGA